MFLDQEDYTLKGLFGIGFENFWRFLGLFFHVFFCIGTFVIFLISVTVLAIVLIGGFGALILLPVIPVGLVGIFLAGTIYSLSQRDIVVAGTPIFEAIGEGYKRLVRHIGPNIIIFLITVFLEVLILIVGLIIIGSFALPIVIIWSQSTALVIVTLAILVPIFILISIVIEGFLGTFFNSLFTLFYLELRKLTPRQLQPQ